MYNSFLSVFSQTQIVGCIFHLGQSIWRKISALGYSARYNTDEDFKLKIKSFCALAFLPIVDVVEAFENLSDDEEIPSEFRIPTLFEKFKVGEIFAGEIYDRGDFCKGDFRRGDFCRGDFYRGDLYLEPITSDK